MEKNKRISFSEYDAERIYEWYVAMCQASPDIHADDRCDSCSHIAKRIRKFIPEGTKLVDKLCKKHPYVEKSN